MVDFLRVGMGVALAVMGALAVMNHPLLDKFKRVQKSWGTKQTASDIEMSEVSILMGRVAGVLIVLFGVGIALGGV